MHKDEKAHFGQSFRVKGTADRSTGIPGYDADEAAGGRELMGDALDVGVDDKQVLSRNDVGRKTRPWPQQGLNKPSHG